MAETSDVARLWDGNADRWARDLAAGQDRYRTAFLEPAFLEFLGDPSGRRVLDAACGEGTSSRVLAGRGAGVVGVDLAPRMIALARERERAAPMGVAYLEGSLDDLTAVGTEPFDLVTCWMAFMDVEGLAGALSECHRVLRPGGTLAFAILHPVTFAAGARFGFDPERQRPVVAVSSYFSTAPYTARWAFAGSDLERHGEAPFEVRRFPRTVSDYVGAVLRAGFELTGLSEPRPDEAACRALPRLSFWRDHAPLYLFVSGRKR